MKVSCGDLRRHKVVREPEAWVVVAATGAHRGRVPQGDVLPQGGGSHDVLPQGEEPQQGVSIKVDKYQGVRVVT